MVFVVVVFLLLFILMVCLNCTCSYCVGKLVLVTVLHSLATRRMWELHTLPAFSQEVMDET